MHGRWRRPLRPHGKALPEDTRRHNRALVLQALFSTGAASRADLARATGLTRVTVSDLVASLLEDGLVAEAGPRADQGLGKPAILVELVPDSFLVGALDLSDAGLVRAALYDLAGTCVHETSAGRGGRRGPEVLSLVRHVAGELVASTEERLLGLGIGTPGVVDETGIVLEAPNLGWEKVPLADELTGALRLPVHVANDANAATLGELTFGSATGSDLLGVRIAQGVGAGLVLDGRLVLGRRSAAGEIGHVVVEDGGADCACGRAGCLETVLAVDRLSAAVRAAGPAGGAGVLAAAGARLGSALAPVVGTLDLPEVVLFGPPDLITADLLDAVRSTVRRRTMPVVGDDLVVRAAQDPDHAVLLGAAVLVISQELGIA